MKLFKSLLFVVCLVLTGYLLIPSPIFPTPPPGSLRSNEPGDLESIYRRAYFTNYSRQEILAYYANQFQKSSFSAIDIPQLLLNYPPEDAFTLIRDQTKSSWLQEFVHIGRESLYVNGFYPTKPTEQININGVHYVSKITVRYIPSHPVTRLTVLLLSALTLYFVVKEYVKA